MNVFGSHDFEEIAENELTAYHLGDLQPGAARAVRKALARDPALRRESDAIAATLLAFQGTPVAIGEAALERNWRALRPGLVAYATPGKRARQWKRPMLAGALAAGVVGAAAVLLWGHPPRAGKPPVQVAGVAGAPAAADPGPGNGFHEGVGAPTETEGRGGRASVRADVFRAEGERSPVHELGLAPRAVPGGAETGSLRLTPEPSQPQPLTREPVADAAAATAASLPVAEDRGGSALPADAGIAGGSAQSGAQVARAAGRKRAGHATDFALALGGSFIPPHNSTVAETEPTEQSNTNSVVALGSFHQQYKPGVGYRVTASYTRSSFQYGYFGASSSINSRIFEIAGTYVLEGPHHGRVTSKADVGGGLMAFLPTSDPNASYVYRGAGVLGASVDLALRKHLSARGAYRAQIFKGPSFRYTGTTVPVMVSLRESNEVSLGMVYRFGTP